MEVKELRIGNIVDMKYINFGSDGSHWEPNTFQIKDFEYINNFPDNYKPIPLTEEWLVKFGFCQEGSESGDDGGMELGTAPMEKDKLCFLWQPRKGRYTDKSQIGLWITKNYGSDGFKLSIKLVKYVHQLQNLYFALTGKELVIK